MAGRDALARVPSPSYVQMQASSYDRSKTNPSDPKSWFSNTDYGQFIRTEKHGDRTEWVIMEHTGPGAVTRIWTPLSADKNKMVVRFYFDGSSRAGIEENFNDMMRGLGRIKPPFAFISWPDPGVADGVGSDMYFPIPFAKSCKITLSEVPFYYSVDYRAYPAGVKVQTFSWDWSPSLTNIIQSVASDVGFSRPRGTMLGQAKKTIAPGKDLEIKLPDGNAALSDLELDVPNSIDPQSLRSTVLAISFDGNQTVWCPIGDFFGTGVRLKPVCDRYRRVTADGAMVCNWTMPYRRTASIRILNLGRAKLPVRVHYSIEPCWWDDGSMYFHATWRHQYPLPTRPMSDWNYLETTGQGVYVGDTLTVMNPSPAWYGEGDEKVYVDGEKFPSQIGTGTEDYYGYAWGMAERFSSPFMAMPEKDRKGRDNWTGYTTTSRVRCLDAIPFTRSLKFDMEIWHWADCQEEYSLASFWYARPGAVSNRMPSPLEAAKPLPEVSGSIRGAVECESMTVLGKTPSVQITTQTSGLTSGAWSNGAQLFLQAHAAGDFAELRLPNTSSGKRHVWLYATKSYDYGIVRFSINGVRAQDVDLWSAKPVASGPIDLGVFDLHGKDAVLRAELVGSNPQSIGDHFYLGLDCVVLK